MFISVNYCLFPYYRLYYTNGRTFGEMNDEAEVRPANRMQMTNDEWCGRGVLIIRECAVRAKAVSPLRSRLRFASARQVATAVQDAAGC